MVGLPHHSFAPSDNYLLLALQGDTDYQFVLDTNEPDLSWVYHYTKNDRKYGPIYEDVGTDVQALL